MPIAPEYNDQIALRLREARLDNKMNQAEFAKRLGISRASVSQWEAGSTKPSMTRLRHVSEITKRPISWFMIANAAEALQASHTPSDEIVNTIQSLPPILREVLLDRLQQIKAFERTVPAWIWKTLPPAGAEREAFIQNLKEEIWRESKDG